MKTPAIIETGPDGGYDIVPMELECAAFFGNGDTIAEAKEDLLNSYKEVLEVYEEEGIPVPEELRDLEFEYKYDIASFLHELKWINLSALAKVLGMNRSLLYQYKKGDTYISHQQMKRIEAGVHELGRKMLEFSVK
ncbi:MAG: type II toxin-antitoxin system HicB family antitoxin [Bacteroidales bacterium]|jgi:predicted RNase H-like HicB family nuclease|nr:type II toxin-antitoxin system HicB family antitoxin [Bacteroidales bacterium]MBR1794114.1 type II toxin-antitoxin system HicB family antitoxin [Bacteroidales bacterium]